MNDRPEQKPLHLPEGMRYACVKCGRGCEDFDDIRLDAQTRARFDGLPLDPLVQDRPEQGPAAPPYRESPWAPGEFVMRKREPHKACSACVLLTSDNLCAVHAAHGFDAKPAACRSFPFDFIDTPGGAYSRLSFACTAVLRNEGPPVSEQAEEARAIHRIAPHKKQAPAEIQLAPQLPIDWGQYLRIETDLADILGASGDKLHVGLMAQSNYLRMLSRFLRQAREASSARPGNDLALNDKPLEVFARKMATPAEGRRWARLIRLAERPRRSPLLRRAVLGYILAFRNAGEARLGRIGAAAHVIGTYLKNAVGRGSVELPRLEREISYREFIRVGFDAEAPEATELLRRFFGHCLFRKDLLLQDDVAFAHNLMLMHYGYIHWYSRAFAAAADRERVGIEDLIEAVRTVEQHFVFHSKFARLFSENPMLSMLLGQMFHRPIYAYAMGNAEERPRS